MSDDKKVNRFFMLEHMVANEVGDVKTVTLSYPIEVIDRKDHDRIVAELRAEAEVLKAVIEKLKTQRSILVSFAHCGDILTDETLERMNQELAALTKFEKEGAKDE